MIIHLISDDVKSGESFPGNKPEDFTIILPNTFNLSGKWEMALIESQIPGTWVDKNYANLFLKYEIHYIFEDGTFEDKAFFIFVESVNLDNILDSLNVKKKIIKFTREGDIIKVNIHNSVNLTKESVCKQKTCTLAYIKNIEFSINLEKILGFDPFYYDVSQQKTYTFTAVSPFRLPPPLSHICIYCDLLEPQIISSHYKRILRIMGTEGSHIIFQNPRYIPLTCSSFSKIKIELKDVYGDKINFKSGSIILCIDIRPSNDHYIYM